MSQEKTFRFEYHLRKINKVTLTDEDWHEVIRVRQNLLGDMLKYDPLYKLGSMHAFPQAVHGLRVPEITTARIKQVCNMWSALRGKKSEDPWGWDLDGYTEPSVRMNTKGLFTWVQSSLEKMEQNEASHRIHAFLLGVQQDGELLFFELFSRLLEPCPLYAHPTFYRLYELGNDSRVITEALKIRPYHLWVELGHLVYNLVEFRKRRLCDLTSLEDDIEAEHKQALFLRGIGQLEDLPHEGIK